MYYYAAAIAFVLFAACKGDKPKATPAPTETPTTKPVAETPPAETKPTDPPAPADATNAATSAPATDEAAAALIYVAVTDPAKADAAAVLVPAGKQVKLTARGGGSGKKSFEGIAGLREAFKDSVAASMKLTACTKGCCDFKPEFEDDRQLGMQVRKICFDDKRVLTSVEIKYEN